MKVYVLVIREYNGYEEWDYSCEFVVSSSRTAAPTYTEMLFSATTFMKLREKNDTHLQLNRLHEHSQ